MSRTSRAADNSGTALDGKHQIQGLESRLVAAFLLNRVVDDGRNLDALCDKSHGLRQFLALSEKDQSLARAIAITALRNRNRIDFMFGKLMNRPPPKNARFLVSSLHVAAAQILFMDIPDRAAVNVAVTAIANDKRSTRFKDLTNAVLRRMTREKDHLLKISREVSPLPTWLGKTLRSNYGKDKTANIADMVARETMLDITVKSRPDYWAEKLDGFMMPTGSIRLQTSQDVTHLPGYEEGEWWVQDAAAAIPARLVTAKEGANVLELCAAPGGKTAQLAAAGFEVTALDISQPRLGRLETNLKRLQLQANLVEADMLDWQSDKLYDAVLLDAPCSSTGTIRRHPDVMWAKTGQDIGELAALQKKLLLRSFEFVKPGGVLVFSNCSILKDEGENLLNEILAKIPDISLSPIKPEEIDGVNELVNGQGALRSLPFHLADKQNPERGGLDGFFACRFVKH